MKVIKNILIFVSVLVLSYLFGYILGNIYTSFIYAGNGGIFSISSSVAKSIVGWPLMYIFLITILFTALGGQKKYWWIFISLIPALLFELYFDYAHIYFPLVIGLVGWAIGWLILKAYQTATKRKSL